jgi:hypothetical protein
MARKYDEFGNFIYYEPDEPAPISKSDIDRMRYELAKAGTMPLRPDGSDVPYVASQVPTIKVPKAPPEPKAPYSTATSIPQAIADRLGISAIPQAVLGVLSSLPAAVARETGRDQIADAIQYMPTSKAAMDLLDAAAAAPQAITGSHMGFGPLAEYWVPKSGFGLQSRPVLTPNDVRVMGKRAIETGREIAAIPEDFSLAQQGLRRESNLGGTTYGAKIQDVAEDIGDVLARQAARRADEGQISRPGSVQVFSDMMPETNLYAVKPTGGQLVRAVDPVTGTLRELENSSVAGISSVYENIRKQTEGQGLINQYLRTFVNRPGIQDIWNDFNAKKVNEEFPSAPTPEQAREAFQVKYPTAKSRNDRMTTFFDEFAALPAAQAAAADLGISIPTFEDYQKRIDAANTWGQKSFANYVQKFVGTKEDPALQLATQGITFKDPERLTEGATDALNYTSPQGLREDRIKAGFSPEGEIQPFLKEKLTELRAVDDQLREMVTTRNRLYEQARTQGVDPASIPEYAELTNKLTNKIAEKERVTQQAENYRLAKSYETLSDLAIEPRTAKDLKRKLTFAEKQLFPYLDKTPDEATLYDIDTTSLDRLGLTEMASKFMDDIVSGKIPIEQIGNISIPKYIQESASTRIAKEAARKKDSAAQKRLFDNYLQEQVQQIPSTMTFGNASVMELTNAMGKDELIRHVSTDTEVLDHCIGTGGNGRESNRQHVPIINPVTGEVPTGSSGEPTTGYVRGIIERGDVVGRVLDLVTGRPVGDVLFTKVDDNEYDIGYASGFQNGRMDPQYTEALKNYLNSKADVIRGSGDNLTKNGIVDQEAMRRSDLRDITGLSESVLNQLSYDGLPRFLSRDDVIALNNERKSMLPSSQLNSEAATLNTSFAELLDENQRLNFDLQNADDDLLREEFMDRRREIQAQLDDIGQRVGNMPIEDITNFARELINDVFPENKKTPRARLQYLDQETPVALRIQPRVYETMREILRDQRDAVGAELTMLQQSSVDQEYPRISREIARTINGNMYNGRAVANNIRNNPDRYGLGEYNDQIIDGIARMVEERGIIDPRNAMLQRIDPAQSSLPADIVERLNNLFGNIIRGRTQDPNYEQAIYDLRQYQAGYQNPPPNTIMRDLTETQRLMAVGEIQGRIRDLEQRAERPYLVNTARPQEQRQDLPVVLDRMHDMIAEDFGQVVSDYVRIAMQPIRYDVATDAPLYVEQLRRIAEREGDPEAQTAMYLIADRLVQGERANIAAARAEREQLPAVQEPREAQDLTDVLGQEMNRVRDNYDERVYNTVDAIMTSLNNTFDLPGNPEMFIDRLRRHARISDDVIVGDVFTHAADLLERTLRENNEIDRRSPPDIFAGGIEVQDNAGLTPEYMTYLRTRLADATTGDEVIALERDFLQAGNPQGYSPAQIQLIEREIGQRSNEILRGNQPALREPNSVGNVVQNLINQYPEPRQVQALINDLERGEISELPVAIQNADDYVRDETVTEILEQLEQYRDEVVANRNNAPRLEAQIRADVPQQAEVRPNIRYGTNVMDAYSGILEDNDQFRTFESLDALRALPQLIRRPGATRNSLGIGQFSNEQANQLARIFDALYDARYQEFVRRGDDNPQLPPPEGRKRGGSIQSSKNRLLSPNTDEMRLALLKGK